MAVTFTSRVVLKNNQKKKFPSTNNTIYLVEIHTTSDTCMSHVGIVNILIRLKKRAVRVILDCDFYTPSSTMFLVLNGCHFPNGLYI